MMGNSNVDDVINARMSARAFTPQLPSHELIEHILGVASRAPSGTNTQPWKVYVLEGKIRNELCNKVCDALFKGCFGCGDGSAGRSTRTLNHLFAPRKTYFSLLPRA